MRVSLFHADSRTGRSFLNQAVSVRFEKGISESPQWFSQSFETVQTIISKRYCHPMFSWYTARKRCNLSEPNIFISSALLCNSHSALFGKDFNMKKILSSLLAAMMLLCLCACTADAPETEAPAEGQSQEEAMKELPFQEHPQCMHTGRATSAQRAKKTKFFSC